MPDRPNGNSQVKYSEVNAIDVKVERKCNWQGRWLAEKIQAALPLKSLNYPRCLGFIVDAG